MKNNALALRTRTLVNSTAVSYKSSAVAEMGDRFATIDMGRGLRTQAAVPAFVNCEPYLGVPVVNYSAKA